MIDEEGRPRPLKVHINAAITLKGRDNVVGEKTAITTGVKRKVEEETSSEPSEVHSKKLRRA